MDSKNFIEAVKEKYKYYTNKEVAEHFGVTRSRVSQWLNKNEIPKRYLDKERYYNMNVEKNPSTELNTYKKIINKQINHIELLENKIELDKHKRLNFIKEVADNWDYDIKIILEFKTLNKTQIDEIVTSKVEVKTLNDYLGYSKKEFEKYILNWADSPLFDKNEINILHSNSEQKRLNAIKHEIDSYVISNHVRYFKKDGSYIWSIYRAHYDLNQSMCTTKLKLLNQSKLNE